MPRKWGITTLVDSGAYSDANLAMALGGLSKGVNPLEMAAAYGVLASNGMYCKPIALLKIVDREGKVLYEAKPEAKRVIDAEAAYLTTNMLQDVLISGTAGGMGIGRPQQVKPVLPIPTSMPGLLVTLPTSVLLYGLAMTTINP
ncbi:penicillin-binding transpeptidase domain-containing protein [Phascolarctobacterium succinatutens]|uniref:penicillin-binding transpeptidase domain-containing protein n=1 Tax=Phascolarctobacterium succinatutens TaxID=626940 RepID=UPI0023F3FBE6|nr:penicillin-binding transpeptidase domain-containing protein [Phascolarctobacterium succinatutens]